MSDSTAVLSVPGPGTTVLGLHLHAPMPVPKSDLFRTCPYCGASPTLLERIGDPVTTQAMDETPRRWQVTACPACGGVVVFEFLPNTDVVVGVTPEGDMHWEVGHLPTDVESHWREAQATLKGGANRSAVVACGRALEAASAKFGLQKGTLDKRIKAMLDDGLITVQFKEAMDYVRVIRNTGAHAGPEIEDHEAEGALGFTQQTLPLLFEVPGALAELDDSDAEDGLEASPDNSKARLRSPSDCRRRAAGPPPGSIFAAVSANVRATAGPLRFVRSAQPRVLSIALLCKPPTVSRHRRFHARSAVGV